MDQLRAAVVAAVSAGVPDRFRSNDVDALEARIAAVRPPGPAAVSATGSRGRTWLTALADAEPGWVVPSVLRADVSGATMLAVVPDPANPSIGRGAVRSD